MTTARQATDLLLPAPTLLARSHPGSRQAEKGQRYDPHPSLNWHLGRQLRREKAALRMASQPSCMPMLQSRPKFWHPTSKTWRRVPCVQTGELYGDAPYLRDRLLLHGGNKP